MNIFAIEKDESGNIDWRKSAQSIDNLRCHKMIVETFQIVSTAMRENGYPENVIPYKSFNPKHPSILWAAESFDNIILLLSYATHLNEEYWHRHTGRHIINLKERLRAGKSRNKTAKKKAKSSIQSYENNIEKIKQMLEALPCFEHNFSVATQTSLKPAMPEKYLDNDIVESYRRYFANKKNLTYPVNVEIPGWISKYRSEELPPIKRQRIRVKFDGSKKELIKEIRGIGLD